MSYLSGYLKKSLNIRQYKIKNTLCLSPMAGLGHIAYRELVSKFGGYGLLFTEMCSARSIPLEKRGVSPVFKWRDCELDHLVCQIFGNDPLIMAKAAKRIADEGFFGVDINMGCSVSSICKQNSGAALLRNPDTAVRIIEAVRKSVDIPLFVKFRTGWTDDPDFSVKLAKKFQDAGADVLTFHPRVAPDRRSRPPKWEYIKFVKNAVSIPVFGNGNVFEKKDCAKMIEETHCDGVLLGRIAVAKPWIFAEITEKYTPDIDIYYFCAKKMSGLLEYYFSSDTALRLFKKFAIYFSANFSFAHSIYYKLCDASCMDDVNNNIEMIFKKQPSVLSRPNMNFFL